MTKALKSAKEGFRRQLKRSRTAADNDAGQPAAQRSRIPEEQEEEEVHDQENQNSDMESIDDDNNERDGSRSGSDNNKQDSEYGSRHSSGHGSDEEDGGHESDQTNIISD
ncbi:unnamed protein product [Arctia plantaginis]|uniref:Uncharacterized protein n=1 Tax=Arctia plantaginis TaxID=874455 RepID=A0A8S1A4C6_ARCPL|nr:unnamed protein product [Arctia plantaginis]